MKATRSRKRAKAPAVPPHPVQPLIVDKEGVQRFKRNEIIDYLFLTGKIDLNQLARLGDRFPAEDHQQLAQLLGYSLCGYGELSYVTEEALARAEKEIAS